MDVQKLNKETMIAEVLEMDYAEEIIPLIREKAPDAVIIVGNPDWSKDLYSRFLR